MSCNNYSSGCVPPVPYNRIAQAVNDALACRIDELNGYATSAAQSALQAAASAVSAAQSSDQAKAYRDQAQQVANTATGLVPALTAIANQVQETAELLDNIANTASSYTIRNWFYTAVGGESTIVIPSNIAVATIQAIYIEGSRQDAGYGFVYDTVTRTITLAEVIPTEAAGTVLTVQLGQSNADSPETALSALATGSGAGLVGTSSGGTVQSDLDGIQDDLNDLDTDIDSLGVSLAAIKPDFANASDVTKGDALIGVKQPYTGAVERTQHDKNAEFIHIKDFGAKGDGVTDDTAAFQLAVNSVTKIRIGNGRYYVGNLTIPIGVTIEGDTPSPWEATVASNLNYRTLTSLIIKKTGTTWTHNRGVTIRNMTFLQEAVPNTISDNTVAASAIASFKDTCLQGIAPDVTIENVLCLGFAYAYYSNPTNPDVGRRTFNNLRGDCTNGIYAAYGLDVDRFTGCHFWPYLTAHMAVATTQANLQRSGTAFYLGHYADWQQMFHCFSYGYNVGIQLNQTNNVTIVGGGIDLAGSVGIQINGNCRFNRVSQFFINSLGFCVNINNTGTDNPDFKSDHCVFNGVTYGVYVQAGSYFSESDTFMGGTGVAFADGTIAGGISNPYFDGVATPLAMTTAAEKKVVRTNFMASASQAVMTTNERSIATASSFFDKRPLAVNNGHYLEQGGYLSGQNLAGLTRVGPRLQNGSVGTESSDWVISIYYQGAWKDLFAFRGVNVFMPLLDGVVTLGAASNRWGQIYSSVGTISTSDERSKTDIESITDEILDAWATIEFSSYKFKDAVESKSEDARIHFGLIAQQVQEAFTLAGLDGFEYGILCYDEWEATPEVVDLEGNITQEAREAGNRYGIRYDEALVLECALQRRTTNKLIERLEALEAINKG